MRKFEFQIYDEKLNLIDRFPLRNVTEPSGLGFKLKLIKVDGNTKDFVLNQAVEKKPVKINVHFEKPNAYRRFREFRAWVGKYATSKMVFCYDDGEGRTDNLKSAMYFECKVEEIGVTEINAGLLSVPVTIIPLTPQYSIERKMIEVVISGTGKTYPYTYPFTYGGGSIDPANRTLNNLFFREIPLSIRIHGKVVAPQVSLEKDGVVYTTVSFPNITVFDGQVLEINAIDRQIKFYDVGDLKGMDYYNHKDHSLDTFIYAEPGISTIVANLDQNEPNAKVEVTFIQYIL